MRNKRIITNWLYSIGELAVLNKECWKYVLRRWWKWYVYILTFLAMIVTFLSGCKEINVNYTIVFFLINLFWIGIVSFLISLPKNYTSYRVIGLYGTRIELIIGDMFKEKCDMVIPTNTCFDVDEKSIMKQSVQGQFCTKQYNGNPDLLDKDIETLLKRSDYKTEYLKNKVIGKKNQYPINTIVTLQSGQMAEEQRFHWIAINHSGVESEVITDSICTHKSIDALWKHLSEHYKLRDLCLPILGTGHAGLNQSLPDVVEYYIDSYINHSKKRIVVKTLKIYLYPSNGDVFENYKYIADYLQYRSKNELNFEMKYPNCS